ncbi:hypothetical protein B0H14DRAFT_2621069 [Mycena olivaceomarginata]|nr:hypothetical protein B0H14DRAFT_2621069 [Mycena olivaceomarginata]
MSSPPASPSPFTFPLPFSSASSSPLGRPARLWSSVPASTAASSPGPETEADGGACVEEKEEGLEQDGEIPFLDGIPLSDGKAARAVRWASGVAVEQNSVENADANESTDEDAEEAQEGELTASQLSRLHVHDRSAPLARF